MCVSEKQVYSLNTSTVPGTDNIRMTWDFGDNLSSVHWLTQRFTYAAPGDYNVTLTVTLIEVVKLSNEGC